MTSLARTLLTEFRILEKAESLGGQESRPEEELEAVVECLCLDAVERILKILGAGVVEAPPPPDHTCVNTLTGEGAEAGAHEPGRGPAHILLYSVKQCSRLQTERDGANTEDVSVVQSAAGDSRSLQGALQRDNCAEGENRSSSPDPTGEETNVRPLSSSPPSPTHDHLYARPSALPPERISPAEGGATTNQSGRKLKPVKDSVETHLRCSRCDKLFPNAERLADHDRKSHPLCSVCGAMFTGILKLREHEIKEHNLLPFDCDYCPKRFNHKSHRDLHVKARHTKEKSCHCDVCGRGFSCVSVMKTHRVTHFSRTFICEVCGKAFYHASHLTRHKLVHQAARPHSCSTCGRGFTQAANLRSHQATHTGERQLCSVCGKSFRRLKNHIISKHSHELPPGELPAAAAIISCQICRKKFPNTSQYRAHQRGHTGEKPYHCDVCGKNYRLKKLLRDHRYTHTGEKPYRCSVCSKTFNLASSFTRHRSIHSGKTPYSCRDCGKHFRLLTFLNVHLETKAHKKQVQQNQNNSADV